jgi:pimeloyl-ACP methyl ester carboxylesterase
MIDDGCACERSDRIGQAAAPVVGQPLFFAVPSAAQHRSCTTIPAPPVSDALPVSEHFLECPVPVFGRSPAETVRWHCRVRGEGPQVLLAMHGFSQTASWLEHLAEPLRGICQLWSCDMPAHGLTEWPGSVEQPRICRPEDLVALLEAVREASGKPVQVLGFSMGGRYAAALAAAAPERLSHLHLVAPESLQPNRGQQFGTRTWLGRWMLRRQIEHPGMLLGPTAWLERRGLIKAKMADFIRANLESRALREQLHLTWNAMHGLPADPMALARAANAASLPVSVYLGRRDMLVSKKAARRFIDALDNGCLSVLEQGHFVPLLPAFGRVLAEACRPGDAA